MSAREHLTARLTARVGALSLDVALDTAPGTLVVIGPNGAGKTSLLSLLLGVLAVDGGRIEVGGGVLLDTSVRLVVPPEARRLAYVPQDYALFPHLTARENVEFALECAATSVPRGTRSARATALLAELGLEALGPRRPAELSGGEKQRVALARALAASPRALLFDEPLAALDVHARAEVRAFLAEYLARVALPTIVVTHDARDARVLADRLLVLEEGRVTQVGTWDELGSRPASRFVERFVADGAVAV
jgi:molybdate transport system ATP-binding protein